MASNEQARKSHDEPFPGHASTLAMTDPELVATIGPAPDDFDALFAPLDADPSRALDGLHDMANIPLEDEPQRVHDDLDAVLARQGRTSLSREQP